MKFWPLHRKKNPKNPEKMRNRFLSFRGMCWLRFKKSYRLVPSLKNFNFHFQVILTRLSPTRMAKKKRNITGLRGQPKLTPRAQTCRRSLTRTCRSHHLMARLLSKQEDFTNQISMFETVIREAGHECIFFLNFTANSISILSSFKSFCFSSI